jgi:hypothetical protein
MEIFYIYKEASLDNKLNDKYAIFPNIMFGNVIKIENHN